jgi:hypothetical protein
METLCQKLKDKIKKNQKSLNLDKTKNLSVSSVVVSVKNKEKKPICLYVSVWSFFFFHNFHSLFVFAIQSRVDVAKVKVKQTTRTVDKV